ncbi:MAG: histidinol-phosphate transaminase [Firmicutes bacterium]|nr:histidinol-phosphate transaminase [Bacillota bacterium]
MNYRKFIRPVVEQLPVYVPGKPIEEVERELGVSGVIKMASNENPLGPSNEVRQAIAQAVDRIALYPDAAAYYLKEALANELGVDPSALLTGNGVDEVNRILAETLFKPVDEVIIPKPTFSMYEFATRLMNAKPILVQGETGLGNDLAAMKQAVTSRTKAIFICNPNNPTGTIIKKNELSEFLEGLPSKIIVVIDEAYADFADDPEFPNGIELLKTGHYKNLVVYRTFSKIHAMAGLRLGYAVADPALIELMQRVKDPFNVNLIAQAAGIAALTSKKHIALSKELVQMGRRQFYEELAGLKVEYLPTQANFILIDCGQDSVEIYQYLLQNGIIVRPAHSFGLPNHIRVTFGTAEQNNRFFRFFKEGLKKLRG